MAETLDKFEEDVLEVPTSTIRGTRRAAVTLDEPITVDSKSKKKQAIPNLTRTLEDRVQAMLNHNTQEGQE